MVGVASECHLVEHPVYVVASYYPVHYPESRFCSVPARDDNKQLSNIIQMFIICPSASCNCNEPPKQVSNTTSSFARSATSPSFAYMLIQHRTALCAELLLHDCIDPTSTAAPCLRPLQLLLPDCVHFTELLLPDFTSTAALRLHASASTAAPGLRLLAAPAVPAHAQCSGTFFVSLRVSKLKYEGRASLL